MIKKLHFLMLLLTVISYGQTPIYRWEFDGSMINSGSATIAAWTPSGTGSSTYVSNRLGQPNAAIFIPNTLGYNIDILNGVLPTGNAARTFCFWAKFVNDTDNKSYPVVGWGNPVNGQAFGFWRNGVQNSYYTWGAGNDYNVPVTNAQIQATNNGWVHVAMTFDGSNLAIYYNGVNVNNAVRTLNTGNQYFGINRLVSASAGTGDGIQLDDLRIYNVALTSTQVQNIYNQTNNTAPTIGLVSVSNVGTTSATINYDVNANNLATTTEIRYAVSPGGSQQIQSGPNATGTVNTTLSQNLTGLLPNTTYEYAVWATNSQGTVFSAAATFTTGSTNPPVITGVTSTNITNTSATINFNINSSGVNTPTTVNYGTSPSALTSSTSGPIVNTTNATPTSINLSGLTANTTYYYQVVATNPNGITSSTVSNFTTLAVAPAPTPIYHYKFSGNLNEENGGPALNYEVGSGQFAYVIGNTALAFINNSLLTPNFSALLPNLPQGNAPRTVSLRLNFDPNAPGAPQNVFSWGTATANQAYGWTRESTTSSNNFFWGPGDFVFSNQISNGVWYTITLVFNGTTATVYKDGVSIASATKTLNTTGTNFWLGSVLGGGQNFLHAFIDDLQIFNTALTPSQITTLNASLSTADFNANNLKFVMYPNPVNDIVTVEVEDEITSIEIYSLQGQKVLSSKERQINVSSLSNGIYMVRVASANGAVATQKLMKN